VLTQSPKPTKRRLYTCSTETHDQTIRIEFVVIMDSILTARVDTEASVVTAGTSLLSARSNQEM
jgi:hypothetical protein